MKLSASVKLFGFIGVNSALDRLQNCAIGKSAQLVLLAVTTESTRRSLCGKLIGTGEPFPIQSTDFLEMHMSEPDHLAMAPLAGSLSLAATSEHLGRRWQCGEAVTVYLFAAQHRSVNGNRFYLDPGFASLSYRQLSQ